MHVRVLSCTYETWRPITGTIAFVRARGTFGKMRAHNQWVANVPDLVRIVRDRERRKSVGSLASL
ncbi:MAG: hypothetical protein ACRELY_11695 [Polyangiaceae bacterium]